MVAGLSLHDLGSDEEDQLLSRGGNRAALEEVAEHRDVAEQRHLENVDRVLCLDDAADHDRAAIGDQNLRGRLLRDQGRIAADLTAEVRRRVLDIDVQEDGVLDRDLWSDLQPERCLDVLGCRGTAQLRRGYDRDTYALLHQSADVVLGHDAGTRQDLQQTALLRHGEDSVYAVVVRSGGHADAAGRTDSPEVREQRDGVASGKEFGSGIHDAKGAGTDGGSTTDRSDIIAPAEAKLYADVAREIARGGNDAGLDFDFLGLAVQLRQDALDVRKRAGNVLNDERVGARVGGDVAARGEKLLDDRRYVSRVGVAEEVRVLDLLDGQGLSLGLEAASLGFLGKGVAGSDAEDVALEATVETVVLEDDVERLIPGHVIEDEGQGAANVGIENDVETADLVDEPEKVLKVDILQVDRDWLASVVLGRRQVCRGQLVGLVLLLLLLLRGHVHGRGAE